MSDHLGTIGPDKTFQASFSYYREKLSENCGLLNRWHFHFILILEKYPFNFRLFLILNTFSLYIPKIYRHCSQNNSIPFVC